MIDHIFTNTQENIFQSSVTDTVILDHSLIFCTRKILKEKYNRHNKIIFHSLKSYLADVYEGTLGRVSFPNDKYFDNPDIGYSDFINELDCVMITIAPFNIVRIRNVGWECFLIMSVGESNIVG